MPNAGKYAARIGGLPGIVNWRQEGWNRGQNSYAEDNEVRDVEWYKARNVEILGRSSIRMSRRGHRKFSEIVGGTTFNGWGVYKNPKTGANSLIVQHTGHVYNITTAGVASEIDVTKTFDVDAIMRGVLLREWFYFGNGIDYMAKTDGTSVVRWSLVTSPVNLAYTVTSAATDDTSYEYGVTAVTQEGESNVSTTVEFFAPLRLGAADYASFTWDKKTDAAVIGYNIYKSVNGRTRMLLTFIAQPTGAGSITYKDDGTETASLIYEAPDFNTTGGIKGNIFAKYANTLFIAGNPDEPDTVFYGGTGSNWESFSPSYNGGWVRVGRGDGERVTAMIGFEDFLFIIKENSVWKFFFGSDGAPTLVAVIPQYGTSSPDTVWRMEKEVIMLGSDGRFRILGYEPNQLNVIRTTDISNRIQNELDMIDKTNIDKIHAVFFEQKYILCNGSLAYPYDKRYLGFLGEWTNFNFSRMIVWDKGTGQQKLFAASNTNGDIQQCLVDGTFDDNGDDIDSWIRFKRIDGHSDNLKYFNHTKIKIKLPRGELSLTTFKDGATLVDVAPLSFSTGGGIGEWMFDEAMFDEGEETVDVPDAIQYIHKKLEFEAYSYYHQIGVRSNEYNHALIQTMSGSFEVEDDDYLRDERII